MQLDREFDLTMHTFPLIPAEESTILFIDEQFFFLNPALSYYYSLFISFFFRSEAFCTYFHRKIFTFNVFAPQKLNI